MKPDVGARIKGFDHDMSDYEVLDRLAELTYRTALRMPILDDDYEAAVEEAARAITGTPSA